MRKIKFKFNKNSFSKLILVILKYRYLLFFIFFSAFSAFTFGFVYKYVYTNINLLEYEESYESRAMLNIKTNERILKEILEDIEQRNKRLKEKDMNYNNPFEFIYSGASETSEANSIDNVGNNGSDNLITSPPLITP